MTLALAAMLTGLDGGSFGPALPSLRAGLGLDDAQAAGLLSAYVVGTLLGNPTTAWINARHGASRALSLGFAVYTVGALVTASSHGIVAACAGRWMQGLGASPLLPLATATLAASVPAERRGRAIMLLGLAYGVAFLVASAFGSVVGARAWRALYAGLAVASLAGGALTALLLPSQRPTEPAPFDLRGFALWCATVASLAVVIWQMRGGALGAPVLVAAVLAAVVFFSASVASGRRVAQPFVPLGLLREPVVRATCVLALATGAGQVFAVSLPSYAAVVVGIAPSQVGPWSLPFVLAGLVGTVLAAVVIDRLGARQVVRVTGAAIVVGAWALAWAPGSRPAYALTSAVIGAGICTLSGGPIRHLVGVVGGADGARAQALLSLVTNLGLLTGSALYGALASPTIDLTRRASAMRSGTVAVSALVALALVVGLRSLPRVDERR